MNRAKIAVASMEELIDSALRKGHRAGMVLDGWQDVNKLHIECVILTAGSAATCALNAKEAYFEHHGILVARGCESFLSAYSYYTFQYHFSDDAGQCARATKIPWCSK